MSKRPDQWFIENYGLAMKIALANVPSPDLARDVVQAAYIEFIENVKDIQTHSDRTVLLRRVVCRCAQRTRNEQERKKPEVLSKIGRYLCLIAQESFEEKNYDLDLENLHLCLDRMPPRNRLIIEQFYFLGRSATWIAQQFGITPRAVFKRIALIRNRLRECLERNM